MSSFTKELITRTLDRDALRNDHEAGLYSIPEKLYDGCHWQLKEEFEFYVGAKENEEYICVPHDFITDLASVPKILWNIYPPFGLYGKAAVLHDFLYQTLGIDGKYTRTQCDAMFLDGMKALKVGWLNRHNIYWGVRIGGGFTWAKYQRNKAY